MFFIWINHTVYYFDIRQWLIYGSYLWGNSPWSISNNVCVINIKFMYEFLLLSNCFVFNFQGDWNVFYRAVRTRVNESVLWNTFDGNKRVWLYSRISCLLWLSWKQVFENAFPEKTLLFYRILLSYRLRDFLYMAILSIYFLP